MSKLSVVSSVALRSTFLGLVIHPVFNFITTLCQDGLMATRIFAYSFANQRRKMRLPSLCRVRRWLGKDSALECT
ncbi:hypothetical protein EDD18DRAFT_1144125 [Armillaria luteobubalina]|uniref:Uncharacterized protein n=1 Tax=Armillaria luteobubalina TaxID=153913 RepID=A0AA39USP9_9AGAR|nr:hypothetical protein EDD18DRAFT_1144125 [Armillaria luteobubalina]